MKQIIAIVKPFLAEKVLEGLKLAPLEALVVREVKGFGRQKGHTEMYRGTEYTVDFVPKIKLEVVVQESEAKKVMDTIIRSAQTGQTGDALEARGRDGADRTDLRLAPPHRSPGPTGRILQHSTRSISSQSSCRQSGWTMPAKT